MNSTHRRYDIDWLRVIAIGLLLNYHSAVGFQYWGMMIGFITNKESWAALWLPMTLLNVWRIPFLFFVSGMGVYFAMQHRTWKELMVERAKRILVPFIFGTLVIVPISTLIFQQYYEWEFTYTYLNPAHLWFLGNIIVYVFILTPVFYFLKKHEQGALVQRMKTLLATPLGLIPVAMAFIGEGLILKPYPYELYAMTWHGFILGFMAFLSGFCFVLCGDTFWPMIARWRWMFLVLASQLFMFRIWVFGLTNPIPLLVVESHCWIYAVLAFGYKHLNFPSKALTYLSEAAYPVYILHMIFLSLGSAFVFPYAFPLWLKFVIVVAATIGGCFVSFEFIRRVSILRVVFGLKKKMTKQGHEEINHEFVNAQRV